MRNVLIAMRPQNCKQIIDLDKTIDVRKSKPKLDTPFKCFIYCTKSELLTKSHYNGKIYVATSKKYQNSLEHNGNITLSGKVIGEFVCDKITSFGFDAYYHTLTHRHGGYNVSLGAFSEQELYSKSCLSFADIYEYIGERYGYAWHISDLVIYDKPKELNDFMKINRECWYATLGIAKRDCSECKNESCFISRPPQSWCYVEGIVYCKNCKHLMFSDCYAECGKAYKGIVSIDDFCDKGELR